MSSVWNGYVIRFNSKLKFFRSGVLNSHYFKTIISIIDLRSKLSLPRMNHMLYMIWFIISCRFYPTHLCSMWIGFLKFHWFTWTGLTTSLYITLRYALRNFKVSIRWSVYLWHLICNLLCAEKYHLHISPNQDFKPFNEYHNENTPLDFFSLSIISSFYFCLISYRNVYRLLDWRSYSDGNLPFITYCGDY